MRIADNKVYNCWLIFRMLANGSIPANNYDPTYKYYLNNFMGESFLLHPDVLLYNEFRHTKRDLTYYLALASLRSYAEYKADGTVTLDLIKAPVHPYDYMEDPSLMTVKGDSIHFLYEEVPAKAEMH